MPVPRAPQVTLANDEQSQLESIVRAHSTPQALSFRCPLILRAAAADGPSNLQVARDRNCDRHTVGRWRSRYLECSQLTATGEPAGELTPWDEIYYLFVPALHATDDLQAIPITRLEREAPWIEERYTCDVQGIIAVEMENQRCHYARWYHLRGSVPRNSLAMG
jgi:hypothetical protein